MLDTQTPLIHPSAVIAPEAVIAEGARIGPNCRIGPWTIVGKDVVLEEGVVLGAHVVIDGITRLGAGVQVFSFATIGLPPQDIKYKGEPTRVEIGPRTVVRDHASVHRGSVGGEGVTRVGSDCLLMAVSHVGHDCQLGNGVMLANNVMLGGHVAIGDTTFVGGGVAVHQFTRIGRQAIIGGMSGVARDVIPFGAAFGPHARLRGLNIIGLKRRGFPREQIHGLRALFRALYREPGAFNQRLAAAEERFRGDPLADEILDFVQTPSRRGLLPAGRSVGADEAKEGLD
ncbi:acyl-ACP--UDP-N-acetylglucosamine O-acyltransferase [Roseomonas sp. NAR14]|uniref:Acyl-[acyl-carrier-protein]--UDP-N-acetylglucosamine O-acyltransferase n=1 Tax=Roseomonas acroporae TaxID=2937791 RepID=A0A9X1YEF6_9PROT|nr:acyl-ACP--UDP-N-acetylglucosamine O-acyltransferase [Roseomonas acroporae]MCK8787142.1 acyl-ACP--UDP-N-acetylglucosamine O-acyltransferase [Roseomonas acroporae]